MHPSAEGVREEPGPWRFTFDDVLRMVEAGVIEEDARVELLDGELIQMAPQQSPHALMKSRLARLVAQQLSPDHEMIVDATMRFAPDQVTEPDLYFYPTGLPHRTLRGSELLLIVEVADTSLHYDLGRKAAAYARLEVPEYWVVNVRTRETTIHLGPAPTGYESVTEHGSDETLSPVALPEVALRMADLPAFE